MNNKFFNQFLLQREMYFSSCYINKLGNFYFSQLEDPIWNFFVPSNNDFINRIDDIENVFTEEGKLPCIVVESNKISTIPSYIPFYYETWYKHQGLKQYETKYSCSINDNIEEVKSVMFATFSSNNKGIQPWGDLNEKYFEIINDKLHNNNIINFSLYIDNEIASVCSVYKELDYYNIFNLAIAPKYQNDTRSLEIFKHVANYFLKHNGNELYIQLEKDSKITELIKEMDYIESLNVTYFKKD